MELLVLGYLIYQTTSSAFQVGLIAVFLNLPRPFVAPFAGVLADRLDRRNIMVGVHATFFGIAIVLLALLIAGSIQSWHVFLAAFLQGLAKVLDDPSRRTAIADLAGSAIRRCTSPSWEQSERSSRQGHHRFPNC